MVDDGVIYSYGRVFFTRASELKEKLLYASHVDFISIHFDAYHSLMEEFTWEGIHKDVYQHMERCIAWMMMERLSQPLPYSLRVRENIQLSHFSSMTKEHNRGFIFMIHDLYSFIFDELHILPRSVFTSCILCCDILEAICSIDVGHFFCVLWRMPHDFRCAPLAPNFNFMISSCRMILAANKWLKRHLLHILLRQARNALNWFHEWNYDPPPSCHMAT